MNNKYYIYENFDTNRVKVNHRNRNRKILKAVCGVLGVLAFFYVGGTIGGLEQGTIGIGASIVHSIIGFTTMCISAFIGGKL